jgi:hypothetical protein
MNPQTLNYNEDKPSVCLQYGEYGWIPVTERLPEMWSFVLVTIKSPKDTWVDIIGFGGWDDEDNPIPLWQLHGIPSPPQEFVTHWMPLPKPAK